MVCPNTRKNWDLLEVSSVGHPDAAADMILLYNPSRHQMGPSGHAPRMELTDRLTCLDTELVRPYTPLKKLNFKCFLSVFLVHFT
jgi:hypothetical protein